MCLNKAFIRSASSSLNSDHETKRIGKVLLLKHGFGYRSYSIIRCLPMWAQLFLTNRLVTFRFVEGLFYIVLSILADRSAISFDEWALVLSCVGVVTQVYDFWKLSLILPRTGLFIVNFLVQLFLLRLIYF